jgi:type I restriction enzyme S subunit
MSEWKTETLGTLGSTFTGLSGKSAADFGRGTPYIPYMNVFTNAIVDTDQLEFVNIEPNERQNAVVKDDILFTASSETPEEVGMSSVLTKDIGKVYLNSFCFGWRLKNSGKFNSKFLAYALRSHDVRHQMLIAAQGSTRHNLSKRNFNRICLKYPVSTPEQTCIAEVLSWVDYVIDKTRALIEKYTNIKAGMMQKLLGLGERVYLGNVVEGFQYGLNAAAKPYDGENKYIRITDIDDQSHLFKKENLTSPSGFLPDDYLLQENDIVFARTGASTGKTYLYSPSDGKIYFAGFLVRARVKKAYDPRFVFYQTQSDSYKRWVQIMSLRSGQPGINAKEYAQYAFYCPTLKS